MNLISKLFSIDSSPQHKRNCAIEGVRGLAILLVFLCHYATIVVPPLRLSAPWQHFAVALSEAGRTGVALFFVLSGYLIFRTVTRPGFGLLSFWGRRAQRIYPAFLAVFSIYLALWLLHKGADRTGEQLSARIPHDPTAAFFYLVENLLFIPGIFPVQPFMNVAWSLSYEWFFYLAIPLGAAALVRISRRSLRIVLLLTFCTVYVLVSYSSPSFFPPLTGLSAVVAAHNGLVLFLAGVIVYEIAAIRPPDIIPLQRMECVAGVAIAAGLSIPFYLGFSGFRSSGLATLHRTEAVITGSIFIAYGLLLWFSLLESGSIGRAMSFKPLRCLGNISYSFYLIHGLPLHLVAVFAARGAHLLPSVPGAKVALALLLLPLSLLFTTCLSLALFVAVERPVSLRPSVKISPKQRTGPAPQTLAKDTLSA